MLILSRNLSETIRISDDITITILESNGRQIKLGIQAPNSTPIHREEVQQLNESRESRIHRAY